MIIRNGRIITAVDDYEADIFIEDEKISVIGKDLKIDSNKVIEATGKYVIPGGIDPHTHFDMPFGGTMSADDFESGPRAAAFGEQPALLILQFKPRENHLLRGWTRGMQKQMGNHLLIMLSI